MLNYYNLKKGWLKNEPALFLFCQICCKLLFTAIYQINNQDFASLFSVQELKQDHSLEYHLRKFVELDEVDVCLQRWGTCSNSLLNSPTAQQLLKQHSNSTAGVRVGQLDSWLLKKDSMLSNRLSTRFRCKSHGFTLKKRYICM